MKKMVGLITGLVLLCGLLLLKGSLSASASSTVPDLGAGSWSAGTEIAIDLEKNPAPYDWYQLIG